MKKERYSFRRPPKPVKPVVRKTLHAEPVKVYMRMTPNNIIATVSDLKNQLISWTSSGEVGIKPAHRKMNIHTVRSTLDPLIRKLKRRSAIIYQLTLLGLPISARQVIKHFKYRRIPVIHIRVETHLPHNGCRLPKRARK